MLSKKIKNIKSSSTLDIQEKVIKKRAEGQKIIAFTVGQPDFDTPQNIKKAAKDAIDEGFTKYTAVTGIDELKDAIVTKLRRENDLIYKKNQVIVSNGGKHALMNAIYAIIDEGDEVIIPTPFWLSYTEMVKITGGVPVTVKTDVANDYKITPREIESNITSKTKLLIINSPNNPTGAVYSKNELIEIAKIAKKYNIYIISDEVYEYLNYTGEKHYSIAQVDEDAYHRTIIINSLSKSYSMTGWRVGYLVANEEIAKAISKLQGQQTSNICSIAQKAAYEALVGSKSEVTEMIKSFIHRRDIILSLADEIKGIKFIRPNGAFYLFIDFTDIIGLKYKNKTICEASDIAMILLDDFNLAVIPCRDFGMDFCIRLSYAISIEDIKIGMERIKEFVELIWEQTN